MNEQVRNYKSTSIEVGDDGIIYCRSVASDSYDASDLAALRDEMAKLSQGKKFLLLMEMKEFEILLTKDARSFMGNDERSAELLKAEAVVIQSTTSRILFNLLVQVNKPKFPFRAFNNEEDAKRWLLDQQT